MFVRHLCLCCLCSNIEQTAGDVGLSMFYALSFLGAFSWFIRQSAEVETGVYILVLYLFPFYKKKLVFFPT